MTPFFLLSLLTSLSLISVSSQAAPATKNSNAHITVLGFVYCDICSNNTFSKHSYFLPGAGVNIDCKFRASAEKTREQVWFSVNRTTSRRGLYRLEIPSVDGINCTESGVQVSCQANLISSSARSCDVPGYKSTTDQISIKSRRDNLCFYSLSPMTFRPSKIDVNLC